MMVKPDQFEVTSLLELREGFRISDTRHRYWHRLLAFGTFVRLRLRDLGLWRGEPEPDRTGFGDQDFETLSQIRRGADLVCGGGR